MATMTFYIDFQGNKIPIRSVVNYTPIYDSFDCVVQRDVLLTPIKREDIKVAKETLESRVTNDKSFIKSCKETISSVIAMSGDDINLRLDVINDENREIDNYKKDIHDTKNAIQFCLFLEELIRELPADKNADKYIYAGVEVPEAISAFSNKYGG